MEELHEEAKEFDLHHLCVGGGGGTGGGTGVRLKADLQYYARHDVTLTLELNLVQL